MSVVENTTISGQVSTNGTPINVVFPSTQQIDIQSTSDSIAIGNAAGTLVTVTAANALKVDGSAVTQPVSGTVTANQGTSPWIISGTVTGPLTDTQLRATPVPVSGTVTANAGTNLNTSALALDSTVAKDASLTTINTSINTLLKPANTLAAVTSITNVVHVDDNTGSLTVDNNGTFAVQATLSAETTKVIGTVNQGTNPWIISATQSGNWDVRLQDGAGTAITSQANGAQRALDIGIDVAGIQIDPRTAAPGTLIDRSTTLSTVSSQVMAANASRKYLFIQNNSGIVCWLDFGTNATNAPPSIKLSNNDIFVMEGTFISTQTINMRSQSSTPMICAKEG